MAFYCETDNDFILFIRCIFRILKYFKDMRFLKLTFLCIMGTTAITAARPASPVATCIPQSNGDCLTILQYGDEHHHYATTIDGYLVVRDSINDYVYADANATASGRKAHNADKRSSSDKSFLKGLNQREIIGKHIKNHVSEFSVRVNLRPDADVAKVEKIVWEELEKLKVTPVSEREFQRVKNHAYAGLVRSLTDMENVATMLAWYEMYGDYRIFLDWAENLNKVTASQVQSIAAATFDHDKAVTGTLLKKK